MKALITGMSGFVGHYLQKELQNKGYEVAGTCLPHEAYAQEADYYAMDVLKPEQVVEVLKAYQPDEIYHLAGQSSVALSWKQPALTMDINVNGTINLLSAVKEYLPNTRVLIVGSSDEYGPVKKEECPVNEEHPLNPVSPYGVSKVAQEKIAQLFAKAHGLHVIMVRPFNHIGAGQAKGFVVSDFASQIAELEMDNSRNTIIVGNLHAYRDFTAVEDVVSAYVLLLQNGVDGEIYNVGSGKATEVQQILETLCRLAKKNITVEVNSNLYRPLDVPLVVCDNSKLKKATGWKPKKQLADTLATVLDDWRKR